MNAIVAKVPPIVANAQILYVATLTSATNATTFLSAHGVTIPPSVRSATILLSDDLPPEAIY